MATLRTVLNNVLKLLREDTIGSGVSELTDPYHLMLLVFFNHIKEIVESQHNWRSMVRTATATIGAGGNFYALTSYNERARVMRVQEPHYGEELALCFDITDSGNPYRLKEMDYAELLRRISLDTSNGNDPAFFAMGASTDGTPNIYVWPTPTDIRTIQVKLYAPLDDFSETDLDVSLRVPGKVMEAGVAWYALEERGEELGTSGLFNQAMFEQILGAAVARDSAEQGGYNLVPA